MLYLSKPLETIADETLIKLAMIHGIPYKARTPETEKRKGNETVVG